MIQYSDVHDDTIRRYFNVRSKADMSQLNLPHGTDNEKVENGKKLRSKKTDMLRSIGRQSRESVELVILQVPNHV